MKFRTASLIIAFIAGNALAAPAGRGMLNDRQGAALLDKKSNVYPGPGNEGESTTTTTVVPLPTGWPSYHLPPAQPTSFDSAVPQPNPWPTGWPTGWPYFDLPVPRPSPVPTSELSYPQPAIDPVPTGGPQSSGSFLPLPTIVPHSTQSSSEPTDTSYALPTEKSHTQPTETSSTQPVGTSYAQPTYATPTPEPTSESSYPAPKPNKQ